MRGKEILRLVESLHRNKAIDTEIIFQAIESALESAAKKHFGEEDEVSVTIDRETGDVEALVAGRQLEPEDLGRIAAQTAKQIITQRIRQAESEIIYQEYSDLKGSLVTGTVQRFEGGAIVVNLEKSEGVMPRSEQIPGEHFQPGERIRAVILDVRRTPEQAKIILSRTHTDFVVRLFELEVPEVAEGVVVVRRIAREPGQRTKVAMESLEPHVDCIGACVGVRGTRIKSIIDEMDGEKIDIIPWREAPEMLIADSLRPAEIIQMVLEESDTIQRAIVTVPEDQLALAIGRKGQNVRLAVKLTGWDIDIQPPEDEEGEETQAEDEAAEPQADAAQTPGEPDVAEVESEGDEGADAAAAGADEPAADDEDGLAAAAEPDVAEVESEGDESADAAAEGTDQPAAEDEGGPAAITEPDVAEVESEGDEGADAAAEGTDQPAADDEDEPEEGLTPDEEE